MFLLPDQRAIPPSYEPPRRKPDPGNAAVIIVVLISLLALFTPVAGGTVVAMVMAVWKLS